MSVFDLFKRRRAERTRSAAEAYWQAIRDLVSLDEGESEARESAAATLDEVAAELAKSESDVEADLELLRDFVALDADRIAETHAAAMHAARAAEAAVAAANRARDAAQEAFHAADNDLQSCQGRLGELSRERNRIITLRAKLAQSGCPVDHLRAEVLQ